MSDKIDKSQAFALLLGACPDAQQAWEEHQRDCEGEDMPYLGMAVFARHIVDLRARKEMSSFPQVFSVIEQLIIEGDEEVRDLAIVGFLESLQNVASWTEDGYKAFSPWLKPNSRAAWEELERVWSGKNSLADVMRSEKR